MKFFFRSASLLFLCCWVFLACSQKAPEIAYGSLELVYYENSSRPVERFSFFVLPRDDDGIEDLDELWLYHDWEGLSWKLSSSDWIARTIEGETWIGTRAIAMADNSALPRGQYRAVIVDKGGARSEYLLGFDVPPSSRPFPGFTVQEGRYRIESAYPGRNLVAYDNEGRYVTTIYNPPVEAPIVDLGLPSGTASLALWAFDSIQPVSAFTGIVSLGSPAR